LSAANVENRVHVIDTDQNDFYLPSARTDLCVASLQSYYFATVRRCTISESSLVSKRRNAAASLWKEQLKDSSGLGTVQEPSGEVGFNSQEERPDWRKAVYQRRIGRDSMNTITNRCKVGDIHIQLTSRAASVTDLIWTIPLPLNFVRIELHRNVENRLKMMSEEGFGSEVKIDPVISKNASVSDAG
jgi:hypothetical protein